MSSTVFALVCSLLVAVCSGVLIKSGPNQQFTLSGNCPTFQLQPNFNTISAEGTYYGVYGVANGIPSSGATCLKATTIVTPDESLHFHGQVTINNNNVPFTVTGPAIENTAGRYNVVTSAYPGDHQVLTIVKADYPNYIAYTQCENKDGHHAYIAVILSRNAELAPNKLEEAKQALQQAGVNTANGRVISQTNCNYAN